MTELENERLNSAREKFFYGYVVVAASFIIMAVTHGTYFSFGVFFTPLMEEFGWTRTMVSGAFSLSMALFGVFGIVMGGLNYRFGPRLALSVCGFLFSAGFMMVSQISALWQLYLIYGVLIAVGRSASRVPLVSTVARWFNRRRALMTGIVLSGLGAGGLIAPIIANWLISQYQWRIAYLALGGAIMIIAITAAQFLKSEPAQVGQKPYGEGQTGGKVITDPRSMTLREAIRGSQFWIALSIYFCLGFSAFVILVHIMPHALDLGISAANAAIILAIYNGTTVVGRIVLGMVADRFGNKGATIIGFVLMGAAFLWLLRFTGLWELYLLAALSGLGWGSCSVVQSPIAASLFGLRSHGLLLGCIHSGFTLGTAVGPIVAGYTFDLSQSYQMAFIIGAGINIIGIILATRLKLRREPEARKP